VHVFIWAFLPWVAAFVAAVASGVRALPSQTEEARAKFVFLCASFFVTFALFSATAFQLDYYTVILFPFAVVLCAQFMAQRLQRAGTPFFLAQIGIIAFVLVLSFSMAVYVANPWLLGLMCAMALALTVYALVQRQHIRSFTTVIYPVVAVWMLYLFLEGMTLSAYLRYGVAYNVNQLLAQDRTTPVYVYQLDPIVAWELGIYRSAPSEGVQSADQLPRTGAPYLLVIKEGQLAALDGLPVQMETLAQGDWVDHKTGTLPRQLKLAKGLEPLDRMRLLKLVPAR